jgi:general secretion pathway protein K
MAMEIVQGRPYKTKVDLDRVGSFQQIGQAMRNDYEIRSDYFLARLMITVNETTKSAVAVLRRDRNRGESSVLFLRLF